MLQRASAEQKALTYKKEGVCFKGTVFIHPERVPQSVSRFRGNGCISLLGKESSVAVVGSALTQHGVGGTAISLLTESKGHKTPTAVSLMHFFWERTRRGSFLPYSGGSISWSWRCGARLEKMGLYMGRGSCASVLLRGQAQPLFRSDLHVGVTVSRHRGDPFTSLRELPFIAEVLGLVSWFWFFDSCIPQPHSAGVKWPICLSLDSAAVIYTS